jgi:hypothetical protein
MFVFDFGFLSGARYANAKRTLATVMPPSWSSNSEPKRAFYYAFEIRASAGGPLPDQTRSEFGVVGIGKMGGR